MMNVPQVTDLHVRINVPLPAPALLMHECPRTPGQAALVQGCRRRIEAILDGSEPRFLVIVGPCSIHDTAAGLEYAGRLAALSGELGDVMELVMRVYFEKPRTSIGWKGLIMDPDLDGTDNLPKGLRIARRFLGDVLDLGVPTATEFLDPFTPQYLADRICWAAIGARTVESQTHRQMASGLSMPVGLKNATNGSLQPVIHALQAARQPQTFFGISTEGVASMVGTTGNPYAHMVLRGGEDGPNCDPASVAKARQMLESAGYPAAMVVDASHANCGKNHEKMAAVFESIIEQRAAGERAIVGAMLESHLVPGNQKVSPDRPNLTYGQSVTDPCIGWKGTEDLLRRTADRFGKA
jgi:3-deoxy-7-phosphoheptulonate synthase